MDIKPTRTELLKIKKRIKLAQKGHKLLKQKRDVLIKEFFDVLKQIKECRIRLADSLRKAQASLNIAMAVEGTLSIKRLALGLGTGTITFDQKKVMGVALPHLRDASMQYQWPGFYGHSLELHDAIVKHRTLFPDFLELAEKQLVLVKISEEIKKTKRRVNALEYITVPQLNAAKKRIQFHLDELERENFTRLKVLKRE